MIYDTTRHAAAGAGAGTGADADASADAGTEEQTVSRHTNTSMAPRQSRHME